MALALGDIVHLYRTRGAQQYGNEAVSQLEHALQCAALAQRAGAAPALVAAAFLHDFGHLLAGGPHGGAGDADDVHQYLAIPFLRGVFPDAVLEPMRLHVDAKRYLCRADPRYWSALSPASQRSLELQGGAYSAVEAERFLHGRYARDAIALRRWDDQAKEPGRATPELTAMREVLGIVAVTKPQ